MSSAITFSDDETASQAQMKLFDIDDFDLNEEALAEIGTFSNHRELTKSFENFKKSVKKGVPLERLNKQREKIRHNIQR